METILKSKLDLSHQEIADYILSQISLDEETEGTKKLEFAETFKDTLVCLDLEYSVHLDISEGDHWTAPCTESEITILDCQVYFVDDADERVNLEIDMKKFKNQIA